MRDEARDADEEIAEYLQAGLPKNFFLYAGAGSGKTSSLIAALMNTRESRGTSMLAQGSKIAVVTYTNAATAEIQLRLGEDSLVDVSTIHAFAWKLVKDFPADISAWMEISLKEEIAENRDKEVKGRKGTAASAKRLRTIARNERILSDLPSIRRFSYSPTQTKPSRGGLSHSQVLKVAAYLLTEKPIFREILVGRYPIVMVDEVQDTNKHVMSALLVVTRAHEDCFSLGLFGDTMQRIYPDGKVDLEESLTEAWGRPKKLVNHRSSKRIVELINQIRRDVDGLDQAARDTALEGHTRLFLADSAVADRRVTEDSVKKAMSVVTGDFTWAGPSGSVKTLLLEHAMAAERLGFSDFLDAFPTDNDVRSSVTSRESIQSGNVHFLGSQVIPLVAALRRLDNFEADRLLRSFSPLLLSEHEAKTEEGRTALVKAVKGAALSLSGLWREEGSVTLGQVIRNIGESGLLELSEDFELLTGHESISNADAPSLNPVDDDPLLSAWTTAFGVGFDQFERYYRYVSGDTELDTHQGVKGLEFPNVLLVLDDHNAKGFLFNYGKLFNSTPLSVTDQNHISAREESTLDRTRRLFYVACSRAKAGLAILLYSDDVHAARLQAVKYGWFADDEVISL